MENRKEEFPMHTRRQFIKLAATAGAALYESFWSGRAWAFAQSPTNIRKFITSWPGIGASGRQQIGQYIPWRPKHTRASREEQPISTTSGEASSAKDAPRPFRRKRTSGAITDLCNVLTRNISAGAIVAKREASSVNVTNLASQSNPHPR